MTLAETSAAKTAAAAKLVAKSSRATITEADSETALADVAEGEPSSDIDARPPALLSGRKSLVLRCSRNT